MSVKNAIVLIKAQKRPKSPKKPNFENTVSERLLISLTTKTVTINGYCH